MSSPGHVLRMALRQAQRNKLFASINILGLAIGLAACLLMLLFIADELSYDRFHHEVEYVYRVTTELVDPDGNQDVALTPAPIGPAILADFPEVAAITRFRRVFRGKPLVEYGERRFYEGGLWACDPALFEVFDFDLVRGDQRTALDAPNSLLLTEKMAAKYFGTADPMGQTLILDRTKSFTVTGVLRDPPRTSHLQFDFIASFSTLESMPDRHIDSWYQFAAWTYLRFHPGIDVDAAETRFAALRAKGYGEDADDYRFHFQPLTDIHLHSALLYEFGPNGNLQTVYLFAVVALLVLALAAANFTNLAVARSTRRSIEVGVRKAGGASRGQLVSQFLGESMVEIVCAVVAAGALSVIVLPTFELAVDRDLELSTLLAWPGLLLVAAAAIAALGLLAAFYPAMVLAAFNPAVVLRTSRGGGASRTALRQVLVVLQFAIAVALLVSTAFVYRQIAYLQARPLGFERAGLMVVNLPHETIARYRLIRDEFTRLPQVVAAGAASNEPGMGVPRQAFLPEGGPSGQYKMMSILFTGERLLETLGVEIAAGRSFAEEFTGDAAKSFLINQAGARELGWDEAVGKRLTLDGPDGIIEGRVVGLVNDFNFRSLHEAVGPLVFQIDPSQFRKMLVRIDTGDPAAAIAAIDRKWQDLVPGQPLDYTFLETSLNEQFRSEERIGRLGLWFSVLAALIAGLGLFGLSAYVVEQRRREIGIRKALGASVADIVLLMARQFLPLMGVAAIIAWPVSYFGVRRWLEGFPYRIAITPDIFLLALFLSLIVGAAAVGIWAIRGAVTDPVQALRYE